MSITATIGHNNAPSDVEILQQRLADDNEAILRRAQELLEAANRAPKEVADDATAEKIGDFVKQITACIKNLDAARVKEKEPYLTLGRAVDGFFKTPAEALDRLKKTSMKPLEDYLKAKATAERLRREREAQEAREAAEAQAAAARALQEANRLTEADALQAKADNSAASASVLETVANTKAADLARTRSAEGSVSRLRTRWVAKITDRQSLDFTVLQAYFTEDAIQKALNAFVAAGGRELRGALIEQVNEVVVK